MPLKIKRETMSKTLEINQNVRRTPFGNLLGSIKKSTKTTTKELKVVTLKVVIIKRAPIYFNTALYNPDLIKKNVVIIGIIINNHQLVKIEVLASGILFPNLKKKANIKEINKTI